MDTINPCAPTRDNVIASFNEIVPQLNLSDSETERLTDFFFDTDFFDAPASTRYHLCCPHGLAAHTINVCNSIPLFMQTIDSIAWSSVRPFPSRGLLCALLHDICKTHFYEEYITNRKVYSPNGRYTDTQGSYDWMPHRSYKVNDRFPLGHGEKSAMLAVKTIGLDLSLTELQAITYHMGDFVNHPETSTVYATNPLALALHMADLYASSMLDLSAEESDKLNFIV